MNVFTITKKVVGFAAGTGAAGIVHSAINHLAPLPENAGKIAKFTRYFGSFALAGIAFDAAQQQIIKDADEIKEAVDGVKEAFGGVTVINTTVLKDEPKSDDTKKD